MANLSGIPETRSARSADRSEIFDPALIAIAHNFSFTVSALRLITGHAYPVQGAQEPGRPAYEVYVPRNRIMAATSALGHKRTNHREPKSTATTDALGTVSCSTSIRFAIKPPCRAAIPVKFPPGRLRLATSPNWTGSTPL